MVVSRGRRRSTSNSRNGSPVKRPLITETEEVEEREDTFNNSLGASEQKSAINPVKISK